MKILLICCLGALALNTSPVRADETPADAKVVSVVGLRDPEWKSYRAMVKGLDTFEAMHQLAPDATLSFKLRAQSKEVSLDGVGLRLVGNDSPIALPIGPDGAFVLPRNQSALDDNAELVLNRRKDSIRWVATVRSPGLPEHVIRLGDQRLSCEVMWAIEKGDVPLLIRGIFSLAGACTSSKIGISFSTPIPTAGATLSDGVRSVPVRLTKDGLRYWPPLWDTSWSNDATITFVALPTPAGAPL